MFSGFSKIYVQLPRASTFDHFPGGNNNSFIEKGVAEFYQSWSDIGY